jgi:hypothetical protein
MIPGLAHAVRQQVMLDYIAAAEAVIAANEVETKWE